MTFSYSCGISVAKQLGEIYILVIIYANFFIQTM